MPSLHCFRKLKAGAAAFRHHLESQARVKGLVEGQWKSKTSSPTSSSFTSSSSSPFCVAASAVRQLPREVSSVAKTALSISEAFARVFATPSAHGTVWPSPVCQVSQVGRSDVFDVGAAFRSHGDPKHACGREACWTSGVGSSFGNECVWKRRCRLEGEGEVGRLDSRFRVKDSLTAFTPLVNDFEDELADARVHLCRQELSGRDDFLESSKNEGNGGFGWRFGDGLGLGGAGVLRHLLHSSAAYHFFRLGPGLPVVDGVFVKSLHDASSGAELAPGGMPMDRSHDDNCEESGAANEPMSADTNSLKLHSGACCLPHPEKVETGGEDAYFICSNAPVVGVADGVGGWADVGVDAGEYARELMKQATIAVGQEPHGYVDPARVLATAHSRTKCKGSSTACILALSNQGLQAANIGDSGFVVVRNGRTIFKSPPQQHQFNMPFQLESGGSDPPSAAEEFSVPVAAGDVIVAATDGVFDNLYDNELTSVVVQSTRGGAVPQVTAQRIAALARDRAQDRNRRTPFSAAAQDAGICFYGGKMDDITVVVSYVSRKETTTEKPGKGLLFF